MYFRIIKTKKICDTTNQLKENRIAYIDGIRGMAALIVVFHHYLLSFYPRLFPANPDFVYSGGILQNTAILSPLNILYNSSFAIGLFFVISGYALSYKYFVSKNVEYLRSSTIRRYFRLEIPILFSVIVSYLLLKFGLYGNQAIAENYTHSTYWFGSLWNMNPDFFKMLKEGVYSSLFTGGTLSYNPVLWTMIIEFMGSIVVFAILALFGSSAKRFLIYGLLIIIIHVGFIPAFIIGLALCDYYHSEERKSSPSISVLMILVFALYIGSYQRIEVNSIWSIFNFISETDKSYPYIIAASFFLFAVINSNVLKRFFSTGIMQFFGKISFSVYLLHLLVIGSLGSFLFNYFFGAMHISYIFSFVLMITLSSAAIVGLSYLMYRYIDLSGIRFSKWVYQKSFTGKETGIGE